MQRNNTNQKGKECVLARKTKDRNRIKIEIIIAKGQMSVSVKDRISQGPFHQKRTKGRNKDRNNQYRKKKDQISQ